MQNVIKVEKKHIHRACKMLERAFYNDPVTKYVFPRTDKRQKVSYYGYKYMVEKLLNYGEGLAVNESIDALILYVPTNTGYFKFASDIGIDIATLAYKVGASQFIRSLIFDNLLKSLHKRNPEKNSYYVSILAVDPKFQGRGYATILLDKLILLTNKSGNSVCLETANPQNVPLYEHFGFRTWKEEALKNSKVNIWAMTRKI